ncbi:MAG: SAM-dependent DNA methyltransferase [Bacteroidales bacterium]|nr:SAM-dependent DNA methyltransferase [Bacteroidales bacterium]
MAVSNIVKRLQNIMRNDAGINGDAQRIEQMTWLFFLKVYDAQEEEWELKQDNFKSIIPEELRWRNWAASSNSNTSLTGDALLDFVNNKLFPQLKDLQLTLQSSRSQWIVKEVFANLNQYMKDGTMLRQVINVIDEIDFTDAEDRHTFGDIYEGILKGLQSAGNAGEFYTPRALTDFIVQMLDPKLGEQMGDFSAGTGGFLVSTLNHLAEQKKTPQDEILWQESVRGKEWKPLPYLLSITNLLLHGVEAPNIENGDSLGTPVSSIKESDKVDVIAMNPPYGGSTTEAAKKNFPTDVRSSETADLFMVLIMRRLKQNGRAGVIIPDGFLFGTDGAKLAIKTALLRDFNLHTIIRLPGSIFAPYTSIATNIVFFNNETAEGAPEGFKTKEVWFYRLDMPEGYKHFNKTNPMKLVHCQPAAEWWNNRQPLQDSDGNDKARCFSTEELVSLSCNFDQCKFPKSEEEILPPAELLKDYFAKRAELDREIDRTLSEIQKILGIDVNNLEK